MRWKILIVLFVARMSMAFQFAAVAALGPLYTERFGIDATGLGFLIGLYFAPAIVVALTSGSLVARFGDRRLVVWGMGLMVAGSVVALASDSFSGQIAGRLVAGVGGVFLNVSMTKMVVDWFSGREIATAMAVFINSWPAGIAAALALAPLLAVFGGIGAANGFVAIFALAALALFAGSYRAPDNSASPATAQAGTGVLPRGPALAATVLAGIAWGLFNAALAVIFSFGPASLVERGVPLIEASATTSVVIWLVMLSGFAGGILADRTGRPVSVLVLSGVLSAAGFFLFTGTDRYLISVIYLGLTIGLPSGIYVSLSARALAPAERAWGMGIFYSVYYLIFAAAPWAAGLVIDRAGSTDAAFRLGAAEIGLAVGTVFACLALVRRVEGRIRPGEPATSG